VGCESNGSTHVMSKNKIVRLTGAAVGGALRGMLVMGAGLWVPVKYARDKARVST